MEEILVYGASWCPDCRRAKKFLADQRVPYSWHDIEGDPAGAQVVQDRNDGKNIIPTIVFPDGSHLAEPTNEELAQKLGLQRQAMQHVYDVIIVGGGPTGLTTSIYAARENLETLIVDSKGLGGQAGVTERLDNYPGFPDGIGGAELADRFVRQAERYGVEMLQAVSVTRISADSGMTADGDELDVETATGDHSHARAVLLATGSSYRRTNADGEDDLIGAGIHFCATCDGPFYKGSDELIVIGGGNSGLEEGVFLTQFTEQVTIIERGDALRGSRILQAKVLDHPRMKVELQHGVKEFRKKEDGSGKLGTVVIEDLLSGAIEEHHPAGVFVFIGLDPNTDFVAGSVDLDERGFVATDPSFMSSMPGVFAAGDVRDGSTKQLASAVGEGAAAAIQIRGYLDRLEQRTMA
jgi:thioredoxin reductase (NADPH)